ncbi:phosphoribosylformylglycinamidine synthase subunit PurQ [bacterium]|nr:phosphoribosylformylglycinamidine synthase subunit PurQ [bacterium]
MHFTVIVFPGTNCDHDCYYVLSQVFHQQVNYVWHNDRTLGQTDCVIVPGGFSYGDYLRSGAIARFSPIMEAVQDFAEKGGLVLGICNGFQILLEAGLLPGAMLRNRTLRFICKDVHLRTENNQTIFTRALTEGQVITVPIAHMDGNYFAEPDVLTDMKQHNQIIFRYCDLQGNVTEEANPNGSIEHIAGIINKRGNIFSLMPHPERCCENVLGNSDGRFIFESILDNYR